MGQKLENSCSHAQSSLKFHMRRQTSLTVFQLKNSDRSLSDEFFILSPLKLVMSSKQTSETNQTYLLTPSELTNFLASFLLTSTGVGFASCIEAKPFNVNP
jgi:hypothetical protein